MIAARLSELLVGTTFRLVTRALFRVRVLGREHAPTDGPALLVSNHLTHLDAFLIGACFEPLVRFLVWQPYYELKLLTWGFRLAQAIPIWERPHSAAEAIGRARRELERGHIICIFAEGSISRTGDLLPFKRGLEAIARDLNAPIVPVHLAGLWESMFSFKGGRFLGKRPRRWRHPVVISFGPPMPASSTAHEVRQAVEQLRQTVGAR
ncbi:MAG TPA: 1-acyl-sn-glycerol-3-phosphate acyltransferase [Bryobacteraceae bacterium]|nr:1-acyl-sn-glycerol-3-phosphate acyltransferase [Bryobacteraceae bacterium]